MTIRPSLKWSKARLGKSAWLKPLLEVPRDSTPPLAMTPPHRRAVGSYGPEACAWIEQNVTERGKPIVLRWWQRLAIYRQLEHDKAGHLVWRTVVESTPRRSGKSTRLRAVALWRLQVGPELFEPDQLVLHTGKDLAIVREVLRKGWPWAESRKDLGWATKRGMTEPEISYQETNRWVARSKDSTTGYDVCLGLVDESWDVKPEAVDDDLEPAMLERVSPQLLLTSTAHRRATSLMRGRIAGALAADDGETLLLWWGALPGADAQDPKTWRAASPHWSKDREKTIRAKLTKALAGESDPEFDDPDPMAGFICQYLNTWPLRERLGAKGTPLVGASWDGLVQEPPDRRPDAAAIEGWFSDGVSLVQAWRTDHGVIVSASAHSGLADAANELRAMGYKRSVHVGATLAEDPALKGLRVKPASGRTAATVKDLDRLLTEGVFFHDGGEHLTEQVRQIRTNPGADGPSMASRGRADAVKAAAWAALAARTKSTGKVSLLLPTSA